MTTSVEFKILEGSDLRALEVYACTQIAQWVADGKTICAVTDSLESAERLDALLWTFNEQSFVAHEVTAATDAKVGQPPLPPVLIAVGRTIAADILVNLASTVPIGFENFNRVAEFVDADPARRDAGRRRFVAYRDRGFPPETHKVGN